MTISYWILYGLASFLALRSLTALMANHKRQYQEQLIQAEIDRQMAERAAQKARAKQEQKAAGGGGKKAA